MNSKQAMSLDYLFARLYDGTVKPFNLPIFKQFSAPVDADKLNAFFAAYKANGWHLEEVLAPYKDDEQVAMCAFYDSATDEYKFCPWLEVLRHNGYHISLVEQEQYDHNATSCFA